MPTTTGLTLNNTVIVDDINEVQNFNFALYQTGETDTENAPYSIIADHIFKTKVLDKISENLELLRKNSTGTDIEGINFDTLLKTVLASNEKLIYRDVSGNVIEVSLSDLIKNLFLTVNDSTLIRDASGNISYKLLSELLDATLLNADNKVFIKESGQIIGKDLGKAIAENVLFGAISKNKVLASNEVGDGIRSIPIESFKTLYPISIFTPLKSVLNPTVFITGDISTVQNGLTANYNNEFDGSGQHITLNVNSVTGSGKFSITGTRLVSGTNVPEVNFTEEILFSTSANTKYKTINSFALITGVTIVFDFSGTINYDIGKLSYNNLRGKKFDLTGYYARYLSSGNSPDVKLVMQKIADLGNNVYEIQDIEIFGLDGTNGNLNRVDGLRSGTDLRSITTSEPWSSGDTQTIEQYDFNTYFTNGENQIDGTQDAEGLVAFVTGQGDSNLTNIDFADINIDTIIDNFI